MKTLPETKKKNGYTYRKITEEKIKDRRYAIYSQEVDGKIIGYELFEIKVAKECEIAGRPVEAHEVFPSDETFGKTAWSFKTTAECYWKLESIAKRIIEAKE